MSQPEQTLCNDSKTSSTKEYLLSDDNALFISFDTAQEAFAWIEFYTPGAITHVRISHPPALTEGEIEFA